MAFFCGWLGRRKPATLLNAIPPSSKLPVLTSQTARRSGQAHPPKQLNVETGASSGSSPRIEDQEQEEKKKKTMNILNHGIVLLKEVMTAVDKVPHVGAVVGPLLHIMKMFEDMAKNGVDVMALAEDTNQLANSIRRNPDLNRSSASQRNSGDLDLVNDLSALEKTFKDIEAQAEQLLDKWRLSQFIQHETMKAEIAGLRSKLNNAVQLFGLQGMLAVRLGVDNLQVGVRDISHVLDEGRVNADKIQLEKDYEAICHWLAPNDPLDKYQDILSRRRGKKTGRWLLKEPKFKEWLSRADKTLWCPGNPGAGKTMLATIVVEYLFSCHEPSKGCVGIACVYLRHEEPNQTVEQHLLSILKQLIQLRKVTSETVITTFKCCKDHDGRTRPSKDKILEMLQCEVDSVMDTFVVVDALDECPHSVREVLLNDLEKLQPKIHLLVTSRYFGIIADRLKESVKLEISARPHDIRMFIEAQIDELQNFRLKDFVKKDPKLLKEIENAVIVKANGIFLLARLHIENIALSLHPHEVREALIKLPTTVGDTYASALQRISNQPKNHADFSFKVLCWVAYSFRSLTVSELLCALALAPKDLKFHEDKEYLKQDITDLCAGMVIIDHNSDVVRLVHQTLQNYFDMKEVREDPRFSGVLAEMAEICLTCLSICWSDERDDMDGSGDDSKVDCYDPDDDSSSPTTSNSPQRAPSRADPHDSDDDVSHSPRSLAASISPPPKVNSYDLTSETDPSDADDNLSEAGSDKSDSLLHHDALKDYAVRYWGEHARYHSDQSENSSTTLCAIDFLCNDAKRKQLVWYMYRFNMYATPYDVTGLHIAAKFGLAALAKALLAKHLDIDAQDGVGNSALAIAIESECEEVVELLTKEGAFVDLLERSGQTILINLAEKGYKDVANQIFQRADQTFQIALLAAAFEGRNTELAQILQNPDLDLKDKHARFGVTALLVATECKNYEVIETLLNHGVDINAAGGSKAALPALHRAACRGYVKIVRLLLENKATIDLKDRKGKTAWTYSVTKHQKKISSLLLNAGADPNTKGALGVSELYDAACDGRLEDVRFMLESGTDPSIETHFGWAPLHWAASHGYYDIVKLLLEYGAKPSPVSDKHVTPLDQAQNNQQWEIVELLKKAGATSARNAQGRLYELENLDDHETSEGNESPTGDGGLEGLRIVCYHQTHHLRNGDFVSLLPLITEATGVTHVILAAIHLDEGPGNIHLNDDSPSDPKFAALWKEVLALQSAGIKVLGMLGGASAGSFARLDGLEFEAYYSPLKDMITAHSLDGLDLDVEEEMSLNGVIQLIDRLKNDFGNDFLITLAPVPAALHGSGNLSGFDYHWLEAARGDKIAWYNTQFYCGWGSMEYTEHYDAIMKRGWPASKVVVGLVTNPVNGAGWVSQVVLETALTELKTKYPGFGGVMGWEYFNSLPGGEERPWEWAACMGRILKT